VPICTAECTSQRPLTHHRTVACRFRSNVHSTMRCNMVQHGASNLEHVVHDRTGVQIPSYSNLARMTATILVILLQNMRLKVHSLSVDHLA
jgi:hypothetical protein